MTANYNVQLVGQKEISCPQHVWRRKLDGWHKCVRCGGISYIPAADELPDCFEELTATERALCLPKCETR